MNTNEAIEIAMELLNWETCLDVLSSNDNFGEGRDKVADEMKELAQEAADELNRAGTELQYELANPLGISNTFDYEDEVISNLRNYPGYIITKEKLVKTIEEFKDSPIFDLFVQKGKLRYDDYKVIQELKEEAMKELEFLKKRYVEFLRHNERELLEFIDTYC